MVVVMVTLIGVVVLVLCVYDGLPLEVLLPLLPLFSCWGLPSLWLFACICLQIPILVSPNKPWTGGVLLTLSSTTLTCCNTPPQSWHSGRNSWRKEGGCWKRASPPTCHAPQLHQQQQGECQPLGNSEDVWEVFLPPWMKLWNYNLSIKLRS